MKIEQSGVAMQACHKYSSECEVAVDSASSFRTIIDGVSPVDEKDEQVRLQLMLQSLISRMLELFSGSGETEVTDVREVLNTDAPAAPDRTSARPARIIRMEWKSERTETVREHESSDFSSTGRVQTADGRLLDFRLELSMSRDYESVRTIEQSGTVELRDPLVINFDGKAVELSGKRFAFDLDVDGKSEWIDGLGSASGYLAIDSNSDGRINDGSELFGTRSGDGFADLAKFDSDGNRWLDEADAVFDTLRIWQHDASGQDSLSTLRDKGVGALYLGSTETPFSLTDNENRLLAQVRASGIYLRENGQAGSLQQIDLAV